MAKFIKSIFGTTERRKPRHEESEEEKNNTSPMNCRRKLSISRSGRMRQANKKRNSLSLELYNQNTTIWVSNERTQHKDFRMELEMSDKRNSLDFKTHKQIIPEVKTQQKNMRTQSTEILNTEEEIDNAFAIIDKT